MGVCGDGHRLRLARRAGSGQRRHDCRRCDRRFGFFLIGFFRVNFFGSRLLRFLFSGIFLGRFFLGFGSFCPAFLRSWRRRFPSRGNALRLSVGGSGRLRGFLAFGQGGFAERRGAPVWPAARSNRARSVRAPVCISAPRPERGGDFLLQFLRLFFQFAGAAFQGDFLGGFWLPPPPPVALLKNGANPFAEPEIGQEQQADEASAE